MKTTNGVEKGYAIGFFHNPGRDEHGRESITHRCIIGLEKGRGAPPTLAKFWKENKASLIGLHVRKIKNGCLVFQKLTKDDIFIVTEESYLYGQTFVSSK